MKCKSLAKTKKQLYKIAKNNALDNDLTIFGNATVTKLSGIMPHDIDITGLEEQ